MRFAESGQHALDHFLDLLVALLLLSLELLEPQNSLSSSLTTSTVLTTATIMESQKRCTENVSRRLASAGKRTFTEECTQAAGQGHLDRRV